MKKKFYDFDLVTTKGGDTGETSLYDGSRRRKDDILFNTVGDIDELSSWLGVVRSHIKHRQSIMFIKRVQGDLIKIGAMIATPVHSSQWKTLELIVENDVAEIERIENIVLNKTKIELKFILPGRTAESSWIDVARTVCRRAERNIISCIRDRHMTQLYECQKYLNRLSDYLFILARWTEQKPEGVNKNGFGKGSKGNF
jgi:cob(I)alamin adenosyltransferase